jgi:hypothetical protein
LYNSAHYFPAISKDWDGAQFNYHDTAFNDVSVRGDLSVSEYIYTLGDTSTYTRYQAGQINWYADDVNLVELLAGEVVINQGSADVDFRVESDTITHALFVQGSDGFVTIGSATASHQFSVISETQAVGSLETFSDTPPASSLLELYHARGTQASPTATQSGDVLGEIQFQGFDTGRTTGAEIQAVADGNWGDSSTDAPTYLRFLTCPDGSQTLAEHMRIASDGGIFMYNLPAGTDNSVIVLNSSNELVTDEIDSRVWGTTLASLANGVDNRVITATDSNGLNGEANLTFDGSTLALTGAQTISSEAPTLFFQDTTASAYDARIKVDGDLFQVLGGSTTDPTTAILTIDLSGQTVGINNSTLKNWFGSALQIGSTTSLSNTANGVTTFLSNNAYYDDTDSRWEFITGTGGVLGAGQIVIDENGFIKFRYAGSASTNGAITWNTMLTINDDTLEVKAGTKIGQESYGYIQFNTSAPLVQVIGSVRLTDGAGGGNRAVYVDNDGDIFFS